MHREIQKERDFIANQEDGIFQCFRQNPAEDYLRRNTLHFYREFPVNYHITEEWVVIKRILPHDGVEPLIIEDKDAVVIPIREGRLLARQFGLDLVRVGLFHSSDLYQGCAAVCHLMDHRVLLNRWIEFRNRCDGVNIPETFECQDVSFSGRTDTHCLNWRSKRICRFLYHRIPVRLSVHTFGCPEIGFEQLQNILNIVKVNSESMKAWHTAGPVTTDYDEIFLYLIPTNYVHPKMSVTHPTVSTLREHRNLRMIEEEKEIYHDNVLEAGGTNPWELRKYLQSIEKGTAWTYQHPGMSLKEHRDLKKRSGLIPKGINRELFHGRGDCEMPVRHASYMTSIEKIEYPRESNLEQAHRGQAALGFRHLMKVADMHDEHETEANPHVIAHFNYVMTGNALDVGKLKEEIGLKKYPRWKKLPRLSPGFATPGVNSFPTDFKNYAKEAKGEACP